MTQVSLSYKKMGIPVPEIARGVNPHESIRQSMFTLEGPVVANDEELAGNHRLVVLDPMGGMPAFVPLAGHGSVDKLITDLKAMCPTHEWTVVPAEPTTETILVEETDNTVISRKTDYLTGLAAEDKTVTLTVPESTNTSLPGGDYIFPIMETVLNDETDSGIVTKNTAYLTNLPEGKTVTLTVPDSTNTSLPAGTYVFPIADPEATYTAALLAQYRWDVTVADTDPYEDGNFFGTANVTTDSVVSPETATKAALIARYQWDQTVDAEDPYGDGKFFGTANVVSDEIEVSGNAGEQLEEILTFMANRLFVIRAGKEFAEMTLIDPVIATEYEGIDAADDTCCRLHKGRISNLCILDLADDPELNTYAYNVKEGECACIFVSEDASRVAIAPASFATDPFSTWMKVVLPNIIVNCASVKNTAGKDGITHANIYLDITCC